MASVNHVFILGNVGNDPKVSDIGDNRRAAQFSVATNERRKDSAGQPVDVTEWHNIVAFGSLADVASKYIRKGTQVAVVGRLRTRDWTDKAGVRRFTTEIVASNIQLLGGRRDGQQEAPPPGRLRREGHLAPRPSGLSRIKPSRGSRSTMTARTTFRFRHRTRRRAGLIAANWSLMLLIMWLDSDGQRRTLARGTSRRPETWSLRRAAEAFGRRRGSSPRRGARPRKRGQGSPGVTFQPKWRGDARTARREGVHGDAGIRSDTRHRLMTLTSRRFESALRDKFIYCFTFNDSKKRWKITSEGSAS